MLRRLFRTLVVTGLALVGVSVCAPRPAASGSGATGPALAQTPLPFDSARAWTHLTQMVAIGPRPAGSAALRQTRAYITGQLSAMGLSVEEQPFTAETPVGRVDMINLIVRLAGRSTDKILFTGHYDTKPLPGRTFVGASDGASSAAFLVELARVLKDRPRELTYEMVWLDGEEAFCEGWDECGRPGSPDNTYGSRYYVQAARAAGGLGALRAMILVDMIGDTDLRVRRDTNSAPWLTDIIWTAARRVGHADAFPNEATAIEDDHLPFVEAGVPSVDIIDLDYPYWHTPEDSLAHVSARSLQAVGDTLLAALPDIEARARR